MKSMPRASGKLSRPLVCGIFNDTRCATGKNDTNVPPVEGSGLRWKIAGGGSPHKVGRSPPPRIAASSSWERAALNDSKVTDAAEARCSSSARARANPSASPHEQKVSSLDKAHETETWSQSSGSKRLGANVVAREGKKPKQPTEVAGVGGKMEIPTWPGDASELRFGVNDTWNAFQCANMGHSVSMAEGKAVCTKLWAEQEDGGVDIEASVVSIDLTGFEDTDNGEDHEKPAPPLQYYAAAGGKRRLHQA